MGNRAGQFDMAHALAAHFAQGYLNTAFFTYDAFVFHTLILAAQAFIVLDRTEDTGAEQTVALRLECTVVDRFRLFDLAVRPCPDLIRGGDGNTDVIEGVQTLTLPEQLHQLIHLALLRVFFDACFRLSSELTSSH